MAKDFSQLEKLTSIADTDLVLVGKGQNGYAAPVSLLHGLKGEKGDKGETGAAGPQGPKGDPGATGATGAKGDKGDPGAAGAKGDKGETGATGAKGADGKSVTAIALTADSTGKITGGTATLSDNSKITITVTTATA